MVESTDIAIIGAGPYGLSLAAHLRGRRREHRVFGLPMQSWQSEMPAGMLLKSDGFASSLSDPYGESTLKQYCAQHSLPYADLGLPVPIETFIAYGLAFQQRWVPDLDRRLVTALRPASGGFALTLEDGSRVNARRVVVAAGIRRFAHTPPLLQSLPAALRSHSAEVPEPRRFAGREVIVVGGGSSAIDFAALLHEGGAAVTLVARREALEIHSKMQLPRPLIDQLRAPNSGIGPSWRSRLFCEFPHLFRLLPAEDRLRLVKNHLGPAAGWFMKERVAGKFPILCGANITAARATGKRVELDLLQRAGNKPLQADHVVTATGYQVDIDRLDFLAAILRVDLARVGQAPLLSRYFESSVSGLFFIGPTAANTFGPVMRFAFGSAYTARRLSRYLATASRNRMRTIIETEEPEPRPATIEPQHAAVSGSND